MTDMRIINHILIAKGIIDFGWAHFQSCYPVLDAHIIHLTYFWGVKLTILFSVGGNLLRFAHNGSRNICNMVQLD